MSSRLQTILAVCLSVILQSSAGQRAVQNDGVPCSPAGQILRSASGTLSSPNYPNRYPRDANCRWLITAPSPSGAVRLTFNALSILNSHFVKIYDGVDSTATPIASLNGLSFSTSGYSTTQQHMYITFTSDGSSSSSATGFSASYSTFEYTITSHGVPCSPAGQFLRSASGTLSSPNYPNRYPRDANCRWLITAPSPSGAVRLTFNALSILNSHFVKIYDGVDSTATPIASLNGLSFSTSGYSTTQQHMYITFTSDGSSSSSATGFSASYSTFEYTITSHGVPCSPAGQFLRSASGTLSSPNYPNRYPRDANCRWLITAPSPSGAVRLTFNALSILNSHFVKIYDGVDSTATPIASLNGLSFSTSGYSTTQQHMYITFTSDGSSSSSATGFSASYSTFEYTITSHGVPCSPAGQFLRSASGTLSSPNYPNRYPRDANCRWLITAPSPSGAVRLTFNFLSILNSHFVKIYDGVDSTATPIASLNGSSFSTSGYSTTQQHMYITFTSDGSSSSSATGFSASYSTFEYTITSPGVTCSPNVQNLTSERGTLTSPNFPSSYPNLANCRWRISASYANGAVRLSFNTLSTDDCCDFVRIYNGFDSRAPILANLSGSSYSSSGYSTTQRYMYITFTSDKSSAAGGFSAYYSQYEYTPTSSTPLGSWLAPTVIASVLALVMIVLIPYCVHRRHLNRSSSRSGTPSVEPEQVSEPEQSSDPEQASEPEQSSDSEQASEYEQSSRSSTPVVDPTSDNLSNADDPISFIDLPPSYDSAVNAGFEPSLEPLPKYTDVQFIPADNNGATNVYDNPQPLQLSLPSLASDPNLSPTTPELSYDDPFNSSALPTWTPSDVFDADVGEYAGGDQWSNSSMYVVDVDTSC